MKLALKPGLLDTIDSMEKTFLHLATSTYMKLVALQEDYSLFEVEFGSARQSLFMLR